VVTVRPDHSLIFAPPPSSSPELGARAQAMGNIISPEVKRAIAVIACTGAVRPSIDARSAIVDAARAIPFFGMLIGFSHMGYLVWIFEGSPNDLRSRLQARGSGAGRQQRGCHRWRKVGNPLLLMRCGM
jgi:hypothetical protein